MCVYCVLTCVHMCICCCAWLYCQHFHSLCTTTFMWLLAFLCTKNVALQCLILSSMCLCVGVGVSMCIRWQSHHQRPFWGSLGTLYFMLQQALHMTIWLADILKEPAHCFGKLIDKESLKRRLESRHILLLIFVSLALRSKPVTKPFFRTNQGPLWSLRYGFYIVVSVHIPGEEITSCHCRVVPPHLRQNCEPCSKTVSHAGNVNPIFSPVRTISRLPYWYSNVIARGRDVRAIVVWHDIITICTC